MKTEKLKNNKGITLIALIITIIVMLILVLVTINVALNGGLFDTARQATEETEKETIYEQIVSVMKLNNKGELEVKTTYNSAKEALLRQGKEITLISPISEDEIANSVTFNVLGKKGTYTYTITAEKIISSTIWQQRGLTSPNVKLDVLYYNATIQYCGRTGLTFGLYSNGDVCANYKAERITIPSIGGGGLPSDMIQGYLNIYAYVAEDKVSFPFEDVGAWLTLKFVEGNKIKVYEGQQADLVDGFVPQTETYYRGELLPQ